MDHDDVRRAGGPAFPVSIPGFGDNGWQGMTIRDWFAGQALGSCPPFSETGEIGSASDAARFAYEVADAMLAARKPTSASQ